MPRPNFYTHNGKTQHVTAWANELGLNFKALYARLLNGWPFEKAISVDLRRWPSVHERFVAAVTYEPNSGCWFWCAKLTKAGYGNFSRDGEKIYAHRYSYEVFKGPIPDGLHILHACDQPACVNPDHLSVGTHADNMADMVRKGRTAKEKPGLRGERHHSVKLTEAAVRDIMTRRTSGAEFGRIYGVRDSTVLSIWAGESWQHFTGLERRHPKQKYPKLTEDAVRHIRRKEMSGAGYAKIYGVTRTLICAVQKRKAWAHVE